MIRRAPSLMHRARFGRPGHDDEADVKTQGDDRSVARRSFDPIEGGSITGEHHCARAKAEVDGKRWAQLNLDTATQIGEAAIGIDGEAIAKERHSRGEIKQRVDATLSESENPERVAERLHRSDLVQGRAVDQKELGAQSGRDVFREAPFHPSPKAAASVENALAPRRAERTRVNTAQDAPFDDAQ